CDEILGKDITDSWGVNLVFTEIGLQRSGLVSSQAVMESAEWHGDGILKAFRFGKVLCVVEREFLTIEVSDQGVSFHDNAGLVVVDARRKGSVKSWGAAVAQLPRVLAK